MNLVSAKGNVWSYRWLCLPFGIARSVIGALPYKGGRTMQWLKVKQKNWTVEEDRWRRTISVASSRGPKGR